MGKRMTERDKQVKLRNDMLARLQDGVEELNKGNRIPLANTLKFIHNEFKNGFTVDVRPSKLIELFGQHYGQFDDLVVIKEDNQYLIAIVKLKSGACKGEYRALELDYYEFQYDEEIDAEAKWEKEAESAYERHLDYKASFDDPRGQ